MAVLDSSPYAEVGTRSGELGTRSGHRSRACSGTPFSTVSSEGHLDTFQFFPQDPLLPRSDDEDAPKRHGSGPMIRNLIDFSACNPSTPIHTTSPAAVEEEQDPDSGEVATRWVPVKSSSPRRPSRRVRPEAVGRALLSTWDAELRKEVLAQWQLTVHLGRQQVRIDKLREENLALERELEAIRQQQTSGNPQESEEVLHATTGEGALDVHGRTFWSSSSWAMIFAWHGFLSLWIGVALALRKPRLAIPTAPFWLAGARMFGLPLPLLSVAWRPVKGGRPPARRRVKDATIGNEGSGE